MPATLTIRSGEDLKEFQERLKDPRPILKAIGFFLESEAQSAFQKERLGEFKWPERYPSVEDPAVNIAGVVSDFALGKTPPARRFRRRPALFDTGALQNNFRSERSVSFEGQHTVVVGSVLDYAGTHQWGGTSSQPVTARVKEGVSRFLKTKKGKKYWWRLFFLTGDIDTLDTEVNQRPFLGITSQAEQDITEMVEGWASGDG